MLHQIKLTYGRRLARLRQHPASGGWAQEAGTILSVGPAMGTAGNLIFLYWISRGNLGSYLDAISFGEAIGESPSTAAVRMQPTKDGVGLNFAQQIPPDFGVLSRVGVSRGTVEAIDLPDINRSISGGLSLTGSRWGRPDDTFGLAGAINRISHQGKLYLAAGGLGGIIGDGQLPNAGREQILETF